MSFRTLGLDANILKAVQEAGYTEPTPIQAAAIPQIIAGHDLIGIAQTGTGKTAAFVLPILAKLAGMKREANQRGIRALVVAPTRELVVQIEENVRAYSKHLPLKVATVFGGVGEHPQIQALRSGVDMVIATPGRLLDLMDRRHGDFSGINFLVLDEADRMLDMGFLPSIRQIVKALPRKRQTLLFSATLSREIEGLTHEFQHAPKTVQIGRRSNPAETVTQLVYEVPKHLKPALLVHLLRDPSMDMVLVFSRMKHSADRIARNLENKGIKTATLHSNRSQNQRLRALKDFKSGAVRVLVATDIAARGIDVDGISHVVNYDFPMHAEDYVHRIGRTGRAHAVGDAISFVTSEDHGTLRSLERFIGRGIVRKKAEGFDYNAAAPAVQAGDRERPPMQGNARPSQPARHSGGSHPRGNGSGRQGASASRRGGGGNNRWRR
ncbi:DEAD/DEAH box helicase [Pedosphaera parvula]|uniref:DEAD-box ATP-dependent RNA helicase RhpA n=1 Tax=Pedosphaera parvula (strain Ellin514) TaxID=320771 RepID=B9XIC3_PEDPL|nr:DEAD/DEAH box helicase [Pedosphaera parvula]EEF60384.1 DEAD/DEAH box helicase domain protein [Pedosphaera parvula Ellin514]